MFYRHWRLGTRLYVFAICELEYHMSVRHWLFLEATGKRRRVSLGTTQPEAGVQEGGFAPINFPVHNSFRVTLLKRL